MHINPEDEPIAGMNSTLFFELKDRKSSFTPDTCACTVSIEERGVSVYSQPLFQNTTNEKSLDASVTYTFPQKDIYSIIVNGKPLRQGEFEPFSVQFDVRVDRTADTTRASSSFLSNWWVQHSPHILIIICIIGFVIKAGIKERKTSDMEWG